MRRIFRFIFISVMTVFSRWVIEVLAGVMGISSYRPRLGIVLIFYFWYWVSTKMFKLSRDEELRSSETPSETELRHAQERRDPALDVAERERLYKMLADMPEAERVALWQIQMEWEEKHGKRNR